MNKYKKARKNQNNLIHTKQKKSFINPSKKRRYIKIKDQYNKVNKPVKMEFNQTRDR